MASSRGNKYGFTKFKWTKDLANQDTRIWSVKDGPAKNGDLEGDTTNK